jgi:hypothetical protein
LYLLYLLLLLQLLLLLLLLRLRWCHLWLLLCQRLHWLLTGLWSLHLSVCRRCGLWLSLLRSDGPMRLYWWRWLWRWLRWCLHDGRWLWRCLHAWRWLLHELSRHCGLVLCLWWLRCLRRWLGRWLHPGLWLRRWLQAGRWLQHELVCRCGLLLLLLRHHRVPGHWWMMLLLRICWLLHPAPRVGYGALIRLRLQGIR